ncbi:MAG TPA: aldo/keto reductase, partial [Pyrinomonadaceae bacterium]|nr:aldo/keto reductase [Pyrinomonadaceae bacterium]
MPITGHATTEGTSRYLERLREAVAVNHFRLEQNLWLSSVGIGSYLGSPDAQTDASYTESVTRAVELGANVIDTAANYRFQRSERAIGTALRQMIESGDFARDEIVVCTKGGYLPFDGRPPAGQEGVRR